MDLREVDVDKNYSYKSIEELMEKRKYALQSETKEEAALKAIKTLKKYEKYRKVLVVTHGDLMRALTEDRRIANCEIVEYYL